MNVGNSAEYEISVRVICMTYLVVGVGRYYRGPPGVPLGDSVRGRLCPVSSG